MATLRQWQYVVRVAERGSFTAAAEELFVSQPGLSQQIRALEQQLGDPLFDRLPRSVVLTPLGRAVLPHARAIIANARRAEEAAAEVIARRAGTLEVATITSIGYGVLPGVLDVWLHAHPDTRITVSEYLSVDELVAAMHAGVGDVAVSPMPRSWDGPHRLVGREEFVIVTRARHPLATTDRVDLADLAAEQWVQFSPDHGLAPVLDRYAAEAGFAPRIAMRTPQTAAVPRFAAAGVGVALVPANIVDKGFSGEILRLHPPRTRAVRCFTRPDPGSLITAFMDTVVGSADLAGPALSRAS